MTPHATAAAPRARFPLPRVLLLDAATCLGTGILLTLGAQAFSTHVGLPAALLFYSGLALFPIAAFMIWAATRQGAPRVPAMLVVWGNAAWVLGSVAVLGIFSPTPLGQAIVLGQAAVVGALAWLEYGALRAACRF